MAPPRFLLHHAPRTRASRILWLLEEAAAPYELVRHDLSSGTHKRPALLALNPFGKLPVLEDRGPDGAWQGVAVTESAAICAYVADALPAAGLAPAIGTPARAAYASWLAFGGSVLEPAFADLMFPRATTPPPQAIGWPDFAAAVARVEATLAAGGPWLLGAAFSAADLMVGSMLQWVVAWGKFSPGPAVTAYLQALAARPALVRAQALEAAPHPGTA